MTARFGWRDRVSMSVRSQFENRIGSASQRRAFMARRGDSGSQRAMEATNGIIHAIDAVIMPRNWQLLAAAA